MKIKFNQLSFCDELYSFPVLSIKLAVSSLQLNDPRLIVVTALSNEQDIIFHLINQPVFAGDPPGPESGKVLFQWFRVTGPRKRHPLAFFDQGVQFL